MARVKATPVKKDKMGKIVNAIVAAKSSKISQKKLVSDRTAPPVKRRYRPGLFSSQV